MNGVSIASWAVTPKTILSQSVAVSGRTVCIARRKCESEPGTHRGYRPSPTILPSTYRLSSGCVNIKGNGDNFGLQLTQNVGAQSQLMSFLFVVQ